MSYQRLYPQRINWEDEPSLATPINQVNLNKMDAAIYGIDGRVVELDENKVGKTETFNTSRNGVVPKPTQADIINEKVLRADGTWVEQTGGGGGGGGHTVVNNAGTSLTQRGKLQTVGGLNATDDSENNTTKITDEYEIIPWTTWQGYSDAQKAEHPNCVVTGAPDCDGDIEIEFMKDSWTNPNPAQAFPATGSDRTITLDTDGNYDKVLILMGFNTTYSNYECSFIFEKGKNGFASATTTKASGSHMTMMKRNIVYVSDTKLTIGDCEYVDEAGNYSTAANTNLIPLKIYTFKDDLTAKIKAIAHDVSTSASKCMMSDEQTSVEDALSYSTIEHVVGKWIDGSLLYEKTIDLGSLPNTTNKNVAHNITNLKEIINLSGTMVITGTSRFYPLPYVDNNNMTNNIAFEVNATNVIVKTSTNFSSNSGYITLRYTKTS